MTALLILFLSCFLKAFRMFAPGLTPHKSIIIALLAAPVLKTVAVLQTAICTCLSPVNVVFEQCDHSWELTLSF